MPDILNAQTVAIIMFLALANNRIVEYFAVPLFDHFQLNRKWLMYVSAVTGLALGMLVKAELFNGNLFDPIVARIIMAVLIAGGSNLIADLINKS
jgi:hypothetical protein